MLEPTRPPTVESGSMTSSTVAVLRVTRRTRPTRPSLLTTVMSGPTPASEPASMVTVKLCDWRDPTATTRAGTRADPRSSAAVVSPSYCSRRLRSKPASSTWPLSSALLASRSRTWSARSPLLRNHVGTAVKGRTAAATPVSAGPKASPTARRAGSSGELPPPDTSSVMSVTLASTRATSNERGGRLRDSSLSSPVQRRSRPSCPPKAPIRSASDRRRGPAGAPRTPRRTSRRRRPPMTAGPPRGGRACRSRAAAARRGRAASRRHR